MICFRGGKPQVWYFSSDGGDGELLRKNALNVTAEAIWVAFTRPRRAPRSRVRRLPRDKTLRSPAIAVLSLPRGHISGRAGSEMNGILDRAELAQILGFGGSGSGSAPPDGAVVAQAVVPANGASNNFIRLHYLAQRVSPFSALNRRLQVCRMLKWRQFGKRMASVICAASVVLLGR